MLILPFFFLMLFLAVQGASVFETWTIIEGASREGARCVAIRASTSAVNARVSNIIASLPNAGSATITMSPSDPTGGTPGADGSVSISGYSYTFGGTALSNFLDLITGSGSIASITLGATTHMRIEEGAAPGTCAA